MPLNVGLTTCRSLCQHPGCWTAIRKQEKGITKSLPELDSSSDDDSDSELNLPTQNVCNLLSDFGESSADRYPLSTGGRPSHHWESPAHSPTVKRKETTLSPTKLEAPNNTKASIFSKVSKGRSTGMHRPRPHMPLCEVQEVFDCADLNSHWDETFVTKQYYIWVANPHKKRTKRHGIPNQRDPNAPVFVKDMTECMVPAEIKQQREDTVLFDEFPVLKKKQQRTLSPPAKPIQFKKALPAPVALPPPPSDIDMEGINELLALPKDILLKVLENTKKSDFTLKGKLHSIVQECVQDNHTARVRLSTRELLRQKKMSIHTFPKSNVRQSQPTPPKPVFQLDDETVIDRLSSANTPTRGRVYTDEESSVESFPKYTKPLPKIQAIDGQQQQSYQLVRPGELIQAPESVLGRPQKAKLPSISLGLPELPSGVRTTKAFVYNNKDSMDFTLGPMISPPSTNRSSIIGDYSDHGTTIKVNAPLSGVGYTDLLRDNEMAIHSVSPALSTHVPHAPAGTPATFMSPTKSAPNLREITQDTTQVTLNLSVMAQPSSTSKDMLETTFVSSPRSNAITPCSPSQAVGLPVPMTPDEKALDTIRETAREAGGDGSVISSSHGTLGDKTEPPRLVLQTSTMTNINAAASPLPKSARSVESCPSPEQWPLISELSFEKMVPRPSISEPALSGRSGRRPLSRSLDDNGKGTERDHARKVMDEKKEAESPAPPPPSPEPKDNSSNEYRGRKDSRSRESLSMAPLFEVNEMDENDDEKSEKEIRRKQVRKIHAVIPQAMTEDDKKVENEEKEEVMVSQITVTHVAPKGTREQNVKVTGNTKPEDREKVQETFLNVDIPAEEISSCKAEHGSSRRDDISSTIESGAKSDATTTNSQVSTSTAAGEEEKKENDNSGNENIEDEENQNDDVLNTGRTEGQTSLDERQYLEMQSDNILQEGNDSVRLNSEDSGVSPELVCDSARFMSHDLVSPMEGEMEGGEMRMFSFLQETIETDDSLLQTARTVTLDSQIENEDGVRPDVDVEVEDQKDSGMERVVEGEETKSKGGRDSENSEKERQESAGSQQTDQSVDVEPPGSFFFQQEIVNTNSTPCEENGEDKTVDENSTSNNVEDKTVDENSTSNNVEDKTDDENCTNNNVEDKTVDENGTNNTVEDKTVEENGANNTVEDKTVDENGANNTVEDKTVDENGTNNNVEDKTVDENGANNTVEDKTVDENCTNNTVEDKTVDENCTNNTVEDKTVDENGTNNNVESALAEVQAEIIFKEDVQVLNGINNNSSTENNEEINGDTKDKMQESEVEDGNQVKNDENSVLPDKNVNNKNLEKVTDETDTECVKD